ncbi:DUF397 domain-containing protein [Streptomyces antibioticus]|uniref:DUF397 domain-containing protein n=1 Tax=Streptomyces antibioticus TaxID=1890 RepID=UPI002252B9C7|nr:DUF397 domain-containing protein [Streptomyces antibioticus]MCX4737644.1 DUF397 domain-containing protein [Streptomyces antibioticus]
MNTPLTWQKSPFSGGADGNNCIELGSAANTVNLRESDDSATVLTATRAPFAQLLAGIRAEAVADQSPAL